MVADTQQRGEETRAVQCIEALVEAHVGEVSPELRELLGAEGGVNARAAMLRTFGYVPQDPEAWARMKVSDARCPSGLIGGGRATWSRSAGSCSR